MSDETPRWTSRRARLAVNGALAFAIAAATALVATAAAVGPGGDGGGGPAQPLTSLAPGTGQHSSPVALGSAGAFTSSAAGWTGQGGRVAWTGSQGHDAPGALQVTSTVSVGGAVSPTFAVTPGQRYSATAWMRSVTRRGSAAPILLFYDASGAAVSSASQLGEFTRLGSRWARLAPVVGFAPKNARTARVGVVTRPSHRPQLLDDVTVERTTGTAARIVGPLRTVGTRIVDAVGRPVQLRGVELVGLASEHMLTAQQMLQQVAVAHQWGANEVRVPLNEDRLVVGSCAYDASYLDTIREVVGYATAAGMLVDLDLENFALTPCGPLNLPPMPDQRAPTFWQTLASEFATNPLVAFDIYNEPHDISAKVWHDGGVVSYDGTAYTSVGMQKLYDTVRSTGAQNLVFVSGVHWATDFPYADPLTGTKNVVYAPHIYTCPSGLPSRKKHVRCWDPGRGGITDPSRMMNRFDRIARRYPVVVTEFGWPSRYDGRYVRNLIREVARRGWSGWTAFAFDGTTSGMFDLVKNIGSVEDPTPSGMAVMVGLRDN